MLRGTTFVHQFIKTDLSPIGKKLILCLTGGSLTGTTREYLLQRCLTYMFLHHHFLSIPVQKLPSTYLFPRNLTAGGFLSLWGVYVYSSFSSPLLISIYHTYGFLFCQETFSNYKSSPSSSSAIAAAAPDTEDTTAITVTITTNNSSNPKNINNPPSVIFSSPHVYFL